MSPEFIKYFDSLNGEKPTRPIRFARDVGRFAVGVSQFFLDLAHQAVGERTYSLLESQADYHPVNKCMNRSKMYKTLDDLIANCETRPPDVTIAFLDVEGLKQTNDTYGHHIGDELLMASAWCMRQIFRPKDKSRSESCVGSWGGDEFIMAMLPGDGMQDTVLDSTLRVVEDGNGKSGSISWDIEQYLKAVNEYDEVLGVETHLQTLIDNGINTISCWYVFDNIAVQEDSTARSLVKDFAMDNMVLLKDGKATHFREF